MKKNIQKKAKKDVFLAIANAMVGMEKKAGIKVLFAGGQDVNKLRRQVRKNK